MVGTGSTTSDSEVLNRNARSLRPQTDTKNRWRRRRTVEAAATTAGTIRVSVKLEDG
jgi:hypothetical protein